MEETILKYFNESGKSSLQVLNNKYRKQYTGVTLNYITYNLLKAKYKKSEVSKTLLELHKKGLIKSLYCHDIYKYVFEPMVSNHWSFDKETGMYNYGNYTKYNLHTYLKQFIKNE